MVSPLQESLKDLDRPGAFLFWDPLVGGDDLLGDHWVMTSGAVCSERYPEWREI